MNYSGDYMSKRLTLNFGKVLYMKKPWSCKFGMLFEGISWIREEKLTTTIRDDLMDIDPTPAYALTK